MPDNEMAEGTGRRAKKGSARWMQVIIVSVLMIGEGLGIFLVTKSMSQDPAAAAAAESQGAAGDADSLLVSDVTEIELTECKPNNRMTGKLITLQLRVSALVAQEEVERAKKLVEATRSRIRDRVNYVVRSADPKHLNEPGLETIKRRIKHELDEVFEDDQLIQAVLIPEFLQSGSGV